MMEIEHTFNSLLDASTTSFCAYIAFVGIGRMALMSWATHRRCWILIYFLLVLSAVLFIYYIAAGEPHGQIAPFTTFMATALWFYESRERWERQAPSHMLRNRRLSGDQRRAERRESMQ